MQPFASTPTLARIDPRPGVHVTSLGRLSFLTTREGRIEGERTGLFAFEARLLSRYVWTIDDVPPECVVYSDVEPGRALGSWIALPPRPEGEPREPCGLPEERSEQTLALELDRRLGPVVVEHVRLTSYTLRRTRFTLALEVDADFADHEEVRSGERRQHGSRARVWALEGADGSANGVLTFRYHAEHDYDHPGHHGHAAIDRSITLRFVGFPSPRFDEARGRVCFDVALAPHERFAARVEIEPGPEGRFREDRYAAELRDPSAWRERYRASVARMARARPPVGGDLAATVVRALAQARIDLASMRIFDLDPIGPSRGWTVIAGMPSYLALFGRDTLVTSWQAAMLEPDLLLGTLEELTKWQGRRRDDWREESPGRMLHEAHTSPLAQLLFHPRGRSYSSISSSALFPMTVATAWHWHGDRAFMQRLLDPALRAMRWRDDECKHDDGFYYYRPRSPQGLTQQGWKDSRSSMVDARGQVIDPPIATCEEQAFSYWSRIEMAELLGALGERELAQRLARDAAELKRRFDDRFWMDDEQLYAMALGPDGQLLRSVASNPGHCLATGIVSGERARAVADRLMSDDLFSGWGVRTLSSRHPAYNPFSYHRGSVWPVENGTFVSGFVRAGLHRHAHRLARALFEASQMFPWLRLPELFGGQARDDEHPLPALYPDVHSPQAWSCSAVVIAVQAMLGLYPYAPLRLLLVDPHLPEWLPTFTIERLRVGDAWVTISFQRDAHTGRTRHRIDELEGKLRVVRQASPWSMPDASLERTRELLESLASSS